MVLRVHKEHTEVLSTLLSLSELFILSGKLYQPRPEPKGR